MFDNLALFEWLFELQDNNNSEKYDTKVVKYFNITVCNK